MLLKCYNNCSTNRNQEILICTLYHKIYPSTQSHRLFNLVTAEATLQPIGIVHYMGNVVFPGQLGQIYHIIIAPWCKTAGRGKDADNVFCSQIFNSILKPIQVCAQKISLDKGIHYYWNEP